MQPLKVLSLFDGLSGTQIALDKLGIPVQKYVAAEVDKYAIKVAQANFPDTIQVGDVKQYKVTEHFDLITFGSPCQGFSFAGAGLNFQDPRSQLFFEAVRILNEAKAINPDITFLMENVRMKKESEHIISDYLGVEPVAINSSIFSAQSRYRLYWTNLNVGELPQDKGIVLKDILEDDYITDRNKSHCIDANYFKGGNLKSYFEKNRRQLVFRDEIPQYLKNKLDGKPRSDRVASIEGKSYTLNASMYKGQINSWIKKPNPKMSPSGMMEVGKANIRGHDAIRRVYDPSGKSPTLTTMGGGHREPKVSSNDYTWRKLTCLECERLQTVPDNYTNHVSNTQRYKMLGNGFNIDTVAFVLSSLRNIKKKG